MKRIPILYVIPLLIFSMIPSCQNPNGEKQSGTAILTDRTDGCQVLNLVSQDGLKKEIELEHNSVLENGSKVWASTITDVPINTIKSFHLLPSKPFENPNIRQETIDSFMTSIYFATVDSSQDCNPSARSVIYQKIKSTAHFLIADTTLSSRKLIIVSDGVENATVSMLDSDFWDMDKEEAGKQLESTYGLMPNLQGFEIVWVFQPKAQNPHSSQSLHFWKSFLESKNASIRLIANL